MCLVSFTWQSAVPASTMCITVVCSFLLLSSFTFYGCNSLTDASLSNICKSLATASINYNGTKTLKIMGITAEQVARLTEADLANMTAAGWTTGY